MYWAWTSNDKVNGAIIMRVLPNTPASEAGLRRHDVVIEMKGKAVRTADEAKQVVDESMVGDVLTVKVRNCNTKRTGLFGRRMRVF